MTEIRVALVMGGGVSLGSFSAGALMQSLRLFHGYAARHRIRVDVATGASAGSMTLAIALGHLYQGATLDDVEAALAAAWVRKIDFRHLLPSEAHADPAARSASPSILSDAVLRDIARKTLGFDHWPGRPSHPLLADGALVSFALANLSGIPVRTEGQLIRQPQAGGASPTGPSSPFADALQTTLHADRVRFRLGRSTPDALPEARRTPFNPATFPGIRELYPWDGPDAVHGWQFFREAALASGAFPGAFPPIPLVRTREEYGALWPEELSDGHFPFDYVDGGLFRNEPLREAIHLAAIQDDLAAMPDPATAAATTAAHATTAATATAPGGHLPAWERVFVLIDPHVQGTGEVYALPHRCSLRLDRTRRKDGHEARTRVVPKEPADRLLSTLRRVATTVAGQATFRDWLKAARVNTQLAWRDDLVGVLADLVPREGSDVARRLDALLLRAYEDRLWDARAGAGPGERTAPRPSADEIRARIQRDLARSPEGDTLAARLELLLDLVANLRTKRKLNLVAITPTSIPGGGGVPLAGQFLGNFGGFFEERFRRHDYAVGEHMAARVLAAPIGEGEAAAPRLIREDAPVPELPARPDPPPSYGGMDPGVRQAMEGLLKDQARRFLGRLGIPGAIRSVAAGRVARWLGGQLAAERPGRVVRFVLEVHGAAGLTLAGTGMADPATPDREGTLRTLVEVRHLRDGTPTFWIEGPHIVEGGTGQGRLRVVEPRLTGARPIGSILLEGGGRSWWEASRVRASPTVGVDWSEARVEAGGGTAILRLQADRIGEGGLPGGGG